MDSAEMISSLPDVISDGPNTGEGLLAAAVEAPESLYPAEHVAFRSEPKAAAFLAEQELSGRESPTTAQFQEDTNKPDENGNAKKVADCSISAGRSSADAVVVQQIMETVEIEVDLITPATNAEGRPDDETVVVAFNTQQEAGHVGLLTDEADGKSDAEEIVVEVIMDNDVRPPISEAQVSSLGESGSNDLGEVPAIIEIVGETAEVTVEGSANAAKNGGMEHSSQVGNPGYSLQIEAVVVPDGKISVNSAEIPLVDEQGAAGAGAEEVGRMELDISSIVGLEQADVEVIISDPATRGNVSSVGKDSAADLRFEEGTSIDESQLMNNSEGETANTLADSVMQLGTGDISAAAVRTTIEEVPPMEVSEKALNATDLATVDLNNFNAPQLESSEALTTLDQRVDNPARADALNGSNSSVRVGGGSAGERTTAAELDSNFLAMPDSRVTSMGQPGGIAEITTTTTTDERMEENFGIGVVADTGAELPLTGENAGPTDIGEIGQDIHMATNAVEREELSNAEQIKINETSCVQLVERTEILGPTLETNVEVRSSPDEVETSLETIMEVSIESPEDRIEDPHGSNSKAGTALGETLVEFAVEKLEEGTGLTSSKDRTEEEQPADILQEMIPNVTTEAGVPFGETMTNVINPNDTTVVERGEDTEMVNPPAAKQEGEEAVAIIESMVPENESGETTDDNRIDPEDCLIALQESIDTTISITTIQQEFGQAVTEDLDSHGVLIGVGSSVESSGLTITEIADTTVTVEVEQQSVWGLSEPLITPPEEEIIEAIGDICRAVDDIVDTEEPPQSMERLVLTVTGNDAQNESNDLNSFDGETHTPSESNIGTQNTEHAAQAAKGVVLHDMEQQTTGVTVVVDIAEPLDLPDERSLLPTPRKTDMGAAEIAATTPASPPRTIPENTRPTNIAAEDIDRQEGSQQVPQDGSPAIAEAVDLPNEDQHLCLPSEVVSSEAYSVDMVVEDCTNLNPVFESHLVSNSMSSCGEEKLSSSQKCATAIVEQVTGVDQDNTIQRDASDVVAPITYELGFDSTTAVVDNSVLSSEARAMESIEASRFTSTLDEDMDGRSNEHTEECALDGSAYVVVDGLEIVEALERKEKKRGREGESDAVAEDTENIPKAAKTSNGEISVLNDIGANDVEIGEDVQVDKKRSRDELETVSANPDVSIGNKLQKIGAVDDNAVSQCRKGDTEEEDANECVDMEDKEDSHEKSVSGAGQDSAAPRYKKRKIAVFLGYSGAGYQGMQKNPGAITIEGELEEALFRAGAIAESNYGHPQKLDWRRAARTDKGVSAVGQVVSGTFFVDPPGFIERVNSHLPKQIRVYGYKRATAGFNAKKLCDRRKYEYVLPVYAFDPTVHLDRETAQALAAADKGNSFNETEIKATATEVSGAAVETDASVVIELEIKETIMEESTETSVEPVGETIVSLSTDATNNVIPKIEAREGNQSSSNGMAAVTEEVTTVTEVAHENVAAGEILLEAGVNLSPEKKQDMDEKESIALVEVLVQTKEVSRERTEVTVPETVIDLTAEGKKEALDEKVKKSTYQFDDAELNRLNRILSGFEGHHNFHNFTARTKATDPSANRYIISFGVENTFTINGIEFVRCSVVGQSFMLHQIRKMIGLAVAIMRGTAPESILATALRRDAKINVPMAPELGLFLEECYYSAYNRRFKATHEEMSLNSFSAEVNEFKKEFIYPHIGSTEARDSTFAMWLHSLNDRHYPDFVAAREAEKLIKSL